MPVMTRRAPALGALPSLPCMGLLAFTLLGAACAPDAPAPYAIVVPRHTGVWQQFCEQAWNVPQASALVAARGSDGWELVAMYNGALCYKRPVAEPRRAPYGPSTPPAGRAPAGDMPVFRDPGF